LKTKGISAKKHNTTQHHTSLSFSSLLCQFDTSQTLHKSVVKGPDSLVNFIYNKKIIQYNAISSHSTKITGVKMWGFQTSIEKTAISQFQLFPHYIASFLIKIPQGLKYDDFIDMA